jgi:hypothetical protein
LSTIMARSGTLSWPGEHDPLPVLGTVGKASCATHQNRMKRVSSFGAYGPK